MTSGRKIRASLTGSMRELIDDCIADDPAFREALCRDRIGYLQKRDSLHLHVTSHARRKHDGVRTTARRATRKAA